MLVKLKTFSLSGIDAVPVEVEVDLNVREEGKLILVGLPEAAVKESAPRVTRSIENSGFRFPKRLLIVNLAPADLPKQAASFDLPISLGVLAVSSQIKEERLQNYTLVGELALDGTMRPCRGVLSMALATEAMKKKDDRIKGIIVPMENAAEASVVAGIDVIPVSSLTEAVGFLNEELNISPTPPLSETLFEELAHYDLDFSDVRGQETAKRAVTVAAAGNHNILMIGPPGTGKTMLAQRFPTVLPKLSLEESLETTRIYSALGRVRRQMPLIVTRPFSAPHYTISEAGLVGGGSPPSPGEISLAHNGVLFLDELPEFKRQTLEVLRQPLEEGKVTIARASRTSTFPSNFVLIAALNPCPCGYRNDPRRTCRCSAQQIEHYMAKMSGPLLDRIDIHIEVPPVDYLELASKKEGTSSRKIYRQVLDARNIQNQRFQNSSTRFNADMTHRQIQTFCPLDESGHELLKNAMNEFGLSARAHDKILRVARTIADMDMSENIAMEHLFEAIGYRTLDRKLWKR